MERTITIIGESKNRNGYTIVEVCTFNETSKYVDVYHVKSSEITPDGNNVEWGKRKNGTFYIKAIKA